MTIKFCSEAYFSGLRFFNEPEISDSDLPEGLKISIDLGRVWTREPWISRRARYPETIEADYLTSLNFRLYYVIAIIVIIKFPNTFSVHALAALLLVQLSTVLGKIAEFTIFT